MNYVDVIVLILWGLAALWGYQTGLIQMVVPLLVVIGGLAMSTRLANPLGNMFAGFASNDNLQTIMGFAVIIIGLLIIAAILSFVLRFFLKIIPLAGLADRMGGAVIGIIVGFILLSGALVALDKFPLGVIQEDMDRSVMAKALGERFSVVIDAFNLIPDDWRQKAGDVRENVQDAVPNVIPGEKPRP